MADLVVCLFDPGIQVTIQGEEGGDEVDILAEAVAEVTGMSIIPLVYHDLMFP